MWVLWWGGGEERIACFFPLRHLALGTLSSCKGKQLYISCVKVLNISALAGVRALRWTEVFGSDFSPDGSWLVLYKPPAEKRMADIQWRIIHGAIGMNRYRAHFDPSTGRAGLSVQYQRP